MHYRPEIDGLRAVAVTSVILYHAQILIGGQDYFSGGFIGVDIFFVISGYLITRIILTELKETGRFCFFKFYERRARRIFPMLIVTIVCCVPFAWAMLLPKGLDAFAQSVIAALSFGSNIFFYLSATEYGTTSALEKPLLHSWSLSVEEQFYILVPILIVLFWRCGKNVLLFLFLALFVMSISFANWMIKLDESFNFYVIFSRVWEIVIGSVIAFYHVQCGQRKVSKTSSALSMFGLIIIGFSVTFFGHTTPHPSFYTLLPVVGSALIVAFGCKGSLVWRILAWKPFVSVGVVSYSLYLWHFPIFAFYRLSAVGATNADKFALIALTGALSIISYRYIEKPFRDVTKVPTNPFFVTLAASLVALMGVSFVCIHKSGYPDRLPQILAQGDLDGNIWNNFQVDGRACFHRSERDEFCSVHNGDALKTVYAYGDSHFAALSPWVVEALGGSFNYVEANFAGCPFILNVKRFYENGAEDPLCGPDIQRRRLEKISDTPSIILIGGRFQLYLEETWFDNMEGSVEDKGKYRVFQSTTQRSLAEEFVSMINQLIEKGHHIIFIYPIPEVGTDVSRYVFNQFPKKTQITSESNYNVLTTSYDLYKKRAKSSFALFDSIKSNQIHRIYPHRLFCDTQIKGRCVTHDTKHIFYTDSNHPSIATSKMIAALIKNKIDSVEAVTRFNERF